MSTLHSINPATGETVGEVQITPVSDIEAVIATAKAAQVGWAETPLKDRLKILRKAGLLLSERADEVGKLLCLEMGKPIREAVGEVTYAVSRFASDCDEIAEALAPEVTEGGGVRSVVYRDAFGVAVCISPWNFPVLMPHEQVLPALAAGNAVILKPSEETPLTGQAYADVLLEVLPAGVLQVVHGADSQGKALVAGNVDLIVFTGSRNAGIHILGEASKGLKRVVLELGGKDPLVVLAGADLKAAAKFASGSSFRNAGQVCISTERIYVEDAVHDEFVGLLCDAAAKMTLGNGLESGTRVGPMVNARQKAGVVKQLDAAIAQGAKVAFRGEELGGNFMAPVVLTNVTHGMDVATEETFGPIASVMRVANANEAVTLANDTPYGLGAVVFGAADQARNLARRMTAGMVGINQGSSGAPGTPWVGSGQSGYGFHSGRDGHRHFAQVRVISERLAR